MPGNDAPSSSVLVIGEALIDIVRRPGEPDEGHPGGSPANVALGLGRLGRPVSLLTALGADEHGRLIGTHLERSGVGVLNLGIGGPTSTAVASLQPDGSAEYDFDLRWELRADALPMDTSPPWVHTGSIASVLQPGAEEVLALVQRLREHAVVSFDPNVRPSLLPDLAAARERIEKLVSLSHIVKTSDEDLARLYPDLAPEAAAARWLQAGPAVVCLTLGGDGSILLSADGIRIPIPPAQVEVQDTVGAGDTWMAAFIDALIDAAPRGVWSPGLLEAAGRRASAASGITVSRAGADLPWASELHPA